MRRALAIVLLLTSCTLTVDSRSTDDRAARVERCQRLLPVFLLRISGTYGDVPPDWTEEYEQVWNDVYVEFAPTSQEALLLESLEEQLAEDVFLRDDPQEAARGLTLEARQGCRERLG